MWVKEVERGGVTKGREVAEHQSRILPRKVTLEVSQESQKRNLKILFDGGT